MKQQDRFLLAFYIGQEIVIHPQLGRYKLDGFYSKGVFATRNLTGKPEDEECEMFEFSEIKFEFKPVNELLLKRCADSVRFIKFKADEGYWVGDQNEFGKSFFKSRTMKKTHFKIAHTTGNTPVKISGTFWHNNRLWVIHHKYGYEIFRCSDYLTGMFLEEADSLFFKTTKKLAKETLDKHRDFDFSKYPIINEP